MCAERHGAVISERRAISARQSRASGIRSAKQLGRPASAVAVMLDSWINLARQEPGFPGSGCKVRMQL